jgi:enoyl-CoA hydratase/carnithine racemase
MQDTVLADVADGIGTVTVNNPSKLNAWDAPMRAKIVAVLEDWNRRADVLAVIVTGAGQRAFSSGQDLDETTKFRSGEDGAAWFRSWRAFYDSLRDLDKPAIAALNGLAAGSAFQFVMLADVRVGHAGVRLGQPEINAGIPSVLGPMLMLERIGLARTAEMTLTGRMIEAEEAKAVGLLHHLVPTPAAVMPKAREIAREMAAKPPIAMRLTKRSLRELTQAAYDDAFRRGGAIQAEAYASGEPQEAMRRFFAERAARGRGPR